MGLPHAQKVIDGIEFDVELLPVHLGEQGFCRLQKAFGPALAELLGGATGEALGRAISRVSESLTPADLAWFRNQFAARTIATWQNEDRVLNLKDADNIDQVFAGRYGRMGKWLAFCVEANYADFLGDLKSLAASVKSGEAPTSTA